MTLNLGDPALDTQPPVAPPRETIPPRGSSRIPWWLAPIVIVAIGVGMIVSAVILNDDGAEQAATLELQEEWSLDTPIVVYEPGFYNASFFVGTDAGLDPKVTTMEPAEYLADTSLVIYTPAFYEASFFVGSDAGLDPDAEDIVPSEYLHDTSLVLITTDLPTFWVGTSGELSPEK